MNTNTKPPASFYFLLILVLFQGLSGLFGGVILVIDPSGSLLQMPLDLLAGSPFQDYLVPGGILLLLLGIFPLVVVFALWKKHPWAIRGTLLTGVMLLVWIGVEVAMVGYQENPPLQAIYGSVGILILLTLTTSSVRQYLSSH